MRMYDIIRKKRDGGELTREEIAFLVKGITDGSIPDYQTSAFTMAVCFQGMTEKETAALTALMAESGDTLDLSEFGALTADKHSTGGVGDKTSLIVAPVAASLGCKVAKMSGRGLGHTGGTVDKLESIPGYKTSLSPEDFIDQVRKTGIAVIGQTGSLAPADKKLYALRDVTATVDSIPLITSSIMSKKIAAGSKNIVLDVKCGSGAFMKTPEDATELAEEMVKIGAHCGRNTAALITDMDVPLGSNIGNALEIKEAVAVLKGEVHNDLRQVSTALAAEMVSLTFGISTDEALKKVNSAIDSGKAFEKMKEWIAAQGGDVAYIENTELLPQAAYSYEVFSPAAGYISHMDAETIGISACILGAGRVQAGDKIDFAAGIVLNKKTGDYVSKRDRICTLYSDKEETLEEAAGKILSAVRLSSEPPEKRSLIYKIVKP